ncbi:unnamed protein product, partial [Iphiclides podalirius]
MNANITIRRIPKISEIEVTAFEEDVTTEDGVLSTDTYEYTIDVYINDDSELGDFDTKKIKRAVSIESDYSEVPKKSVIDYSFFVEEATVRSNNEDVMSGKDLRDVEVFRKLNVGEKGIQNQVQQQCSFNGSIEEFTRAVFPWIAAIFVKNGKSEQFDYYCDGALLSDRAILTAANCVSHNMTVVEADDVIVVLGKGSLKTMGDKEKVVKVSEIRLHDNFTSKYEDGHDLAVIRIDEPISSSDAVHPACLATGNDTDDFIKDDFDIATTGWAISNELTPICLDREKSKLCQKDVISDDTFCANYNNDVTTCPSYGGVFAAKAADEVWRLRGLRTGDPSQKGFCINTGVFYTDLLLHTEWIQNNI